MSTSPEGHILPINHNVGIQPSYAHAELVPNNEGDLHLRASEGTIDGRFLDATVDEQLSAGIAALQRQGKLVNRRMSQQDFRGIPGNEDKGVFITTGNDEERAKFRTKLEELREQEARRQEIARKLEAARKAMQSATPRQR